MPMAALTLALADPLETLESGSPSGVGGKVPPCSPPLRKYSRILSSGLEKETCLEVSDGL